MKACFDSSALVAALLRQHPHHGLAFPHPRAVHEGTVQGYLTTHCPAELLATLTALPLKPRHLPADVQFLIGKSVLTHFTIIPLGTRVYQDAMDLTVAKNPAIGAIYDALHLTGAQSAGHATIYAEPAALPRPCARQSSRLAPLEPLKRQLARQFPRLSGRRPLRARWGIRRRVARLPDDSFQWPGAQ